MQWKAPIFIMLALFLSGCSLFSTGSNDYSEEFILQAEKEAEHFLRANYDNVDEVTFSEDHSDPIGGLVLEGTVNGEATFNIGVNEDYTVGGIGKGKGFPERKEACREHSCDYGQLEE
ncbi:hypothetical protein [Guptibacillus sedimenti]|uniref:hypothetical protein n=1 Tax=Guptibacillus sedimenti TaxID=3025680 RepID=UPI002360F733|nr:hypothetical protein [Pseudalkalibacillus sedimenti]